MNRPFLLLLIFCTQAAWAQVKPVRIPVVVHVIYGDSSRDNGISAATKENGNNTMYLSKNKIEAEIADLHKDFLLLNTDTSIVLSDFKKAIGNPNMDFFLSEVKYVKAKRSTITAPFTNISLLCRLSPIVDSKKYLNVYVSSIKFRGSGTNGVATVKSSKEAGGAQDAVFLNYKWVGLGYRLLTHETGHWLGLWHPWTLVKSDGVDDIPSQLDATHTPCELCPPAVKDQLKAGQSFKHSNYNNFMDYSGCRVMFSAKQSARIQKVISDYRPELQQ